MPVDHLFAWIGQNISNRQANELANNLETAIDIPILSVYSEGASSIGSVRPTNPIMPYA